VTKYMFLWSPNYDRGLPNNTTTPKLVDMQDAGGYGTGLCMTLLPECMEVAWPSMVSLIVLRTTVHGRIHAQTLSSTGDHHLGLHSISPTV
jgi:hypothetical protein